MRPCTSVCPSFLSTRLSSQDRWPWSSTSIYPGAMRTTISCKTCPGPWSTSSMSSLPPPVSRTRMGTTSTRSSRTSSSQRTSEPTCLARASRVWICAGFALDQATRRPPAWMRKTSCRASTATSTASTWTTRF